MDSSSTATGHSIIFKIPEIVRLICENITYTDDLVRLMTVSRLFFACVAPRRWASIGGAKKLCRLALPQLDRKTLKEGKITRGDLEDFLLPSQESLARFSVYASYVKEVRTHYIERGWGTLWEVLLEVVPLRPLLPNLQRFTLFDHADSKQLSMIIDALICPTLVELRTPGCAWGSLHPLSSSYLVSRLVESSTEIHTLELYTRSLYPEPRTTETVLETPPKVTLFASLGDGAPRLCNLRTIGLGPEVFSPDVLALLGTLPSLESFTICFPYEMPTHLFPSTFPPLPSAFPALRHLGIFCQSVTLVAQLWPILPFVHRLKSVYVKALLAEDVDDEPDLVCSICQHSPNVTDLCLDFASHLSSLELLTPIVVHQLGRLPLERVRIVAWSAELLPPDGERFALALSSVEYLRLEDCRFTLEDLKCMASYMPKLRFFLAQLELPDPSTVDEPFLPSVDSPSPSIIHLETAFTVDLRSDFDIDEVEGRYIVSLARTLHMLWPNGVHCELSERACDGGNCTESDLQSLELLNTTLKQMCSLKESDIQAMDQHSASEWEYVNSTNIRWLNSY